MVVVQEVSNYQAHQFLLLVLLCQFLKEDSVGPRQVGVDLYLLGAILEEVIGLGVEVTLQGDVQAICIVTRYLLVVLHDEHPTPHLNGNRFCFLSFGIRFRS